MIDLLARYQGCLLGLAAGDALGAPVEFQQPGDFEPVTDLRGEGTYSLSPGRWTDDTSMALCLAESLVEKQGFDPVDQLERYLRWYREGYWSSTGSCFDIGRTTEAAFLDFERTRQPYRKPDGQPASNGSLMRLAPVPMAFARLPLLAIQHAADSSRTTHSAAAAADACRYLSSLITGALHGEPKEILLSSLYAPVECYWHDDPLVPELRAVAEGSFKQRMPPEIRAGSLAVECLEAALWAFYSTDDFVSGCLLAVNLGNDSDTVGAVYGSLAGAAYGLDGIPLAWREKIYQCDQILALSEKLLDLSLKISPEVSSRKDR